ncbi:MAG: hypothetical protein D6722_01515 [Bacteroidetes bacterium]|nr:MAG: hypothetical protein D6722_01515 [Bacteroidota bacterium]
MEESKVPILILGTGIEARLALDIALDLDVLVLGYLTDDEEELHAELNDVLVSAVLGSADAEQLLSDEHTRVVVAIGDAEQRREAVEGIDAYPARIESLHAPSLQLSPYAQLGRGNLIGGGTHIQANAMIGSFNQIGVQVAIGAQALIGDYCTLQDGVRIGKEAEIADEAFIGLGAIIYPGVKVGQGAMVAAGAVVMQEVPEKATVFGNPARVAGGG